MGYISKMFDVKQHCQVIDCNRAASTKCFCCNKNICTRHFTEHIETVKAQIDPLANDVNSMREKIQSLNVEQITETSLAQLYQWKSNMHELIDEIFSVKTKEIMDLTEKNMNHFKKYKEQQCLTMITIQDAVRQLIEEDDVTFQQIQVIRKALAEVETDLVAFKNNFISINTKVFSQNLVSVSSKLSPGISVKQQPPSELFFFPCKIFFYHFNSKVSMKERIIQHMITVV